MTHNGVDIVDFVLYAIYPFAAFFAIGLIARKTHLRPLYTYILQAAVCFAFAGAYFLIPQGGGEGLAIVLVMFGGLLLIMARRQRIHPAEQQNA